MIEPLALSRLLQLASPMLPVGAYSYSQGLEWAVEERLIHDAATAEAWIGDVMEHSLGRFELPLLWRICHAWKRQEMERLNHWNDLFCAGRDTSESHAETTRMGYSLARLLEVLPMDGDALRQLNSLPQISFPAAYGCAATHWKIPFPEALQAYAWSWLENQVSAAMKCVPLGQSDGQRLLFALGGRLPPLVERASTLEDGEITNFTPGLSMAGCHHETQYSRLFRS